MNIAENVKAICRAKNISISDLAKQMNLLQPSLSRMLHNENITLDRLVLIAELLGCTIADLTNEQSVKDSIICPHCGKQIKIKIDIK